MIHLQEVFGRFQIPLVKRGKVSCKLCPFGILSMCLRKCFTSSHVDKGEVLKPCETRDQIVPVFETTTLHW